MMTDTELRETLTALLAQIKAAPEDRYQYFDELHALLGNMKAAGMEIPPELENLDALLDNEAGEMMFDNLPV